MNLGSFRLSLDNIMKIISLYNPRINFLHSFNCRVIRQISWVMRSLSAFYRFSGFVTKTFRVSPKNRDGVRSGDLFMHNLNWKFSSGWRKSRVTSIMWVSCVAESLSYHIENLYLTDAGISRRDCHYSILKKLLIGSISQTVIKNIMEENLFALVWSGSQEDPLLRHRKFISIIKENNSS